MNGDLEEWKVRRESWEDEPDSAVNERMNRQ